MFTGLVSAMGTVAAAAPRNGGLDLELEAPYSDQQVGESIAVAGCCLTIERLTLRGFAVHVVPTSLVRTRFGQVVAGDRLNLERALRAGDRLGGHWVQGHVDGIGLVRSVSDQGSARLVDIAVPAAVAEITIPLGSITIDGVSMTVNAMTPPDRVQLSVIPQTMRDTTLGALVPGDSVHVEGDLIGKHVRAMAGSRFES
ncbi:MAG TPA: riboflavin synthase [Gemmatimonadales bacterium]|nr:riboflavin synthase [Gemmatimonadales bacterium]